MPFIIKAISDAREKYGYPESERSVLTSFIDGK